MPAILPYQNIQVAASSSEGKRARSQGAIPVSMQVEINEQDPQGYVNLYSYGTTQWPSENYSNSWTASGGKGVNKNVKPTLPAGYLAGRLPTDITNSHSDAQMQTNTSLLVIVVAAVVVDWAGTAMNVAKLVTTLIAVSKEAILAPGHSQPEKGAQSWRGPQLGHLHA